jgi:glycosyltransferase involved in cell wall biosynthesis
VVPAKPDGAPRVAMVTTRFAPFLGGIETHVHEVAARLADHGVDVTVLTADPSGSSPTQEQMGPVAVRRFPAWPRTSDFCTSPALVQQTLDGGYDLVHVQGVHAALPPTVLASVQRAGLPTVVTFHTGGHSSRVRNVLRDTQWRALRPLLRRADALVAVCAYEVERFSRLLRVEPGRMRLIANGAEPLPGAETPTAVTGDPLVVSVGRLERYKGHHRLIAAMPALCAAAPGARLVIVGRGPFERPLRRLAADLGVERSVTFTSFDHTRRAELGSLLAAADVVALMSDYEAHPVAVMEALALGRKIVVADTSGLAELDRHDLVTTVHPCAPAEYVARVLARVADAPGGQAPPLATWDDCAAELAALYGDVLARRAQARALQR